MTTIKEEYNKMIKQIFGDKLRKGLKEFIYQWHIQQQIKLLEEVKKAIVYSDLGKGKLDKKIMLNHINLLKNPYENKI